MHANLPEIAKRWERDYAGGGIARVGYQQGMGVAPVPPNNMISNMQKMRPTTLGIMTGQYMPGISPHFGGYGPIDPYGNIQMGLENPDKDFYQSPQGLAFLKNKMGNMFSGATNTIGNMFTGAKDAVSGIFSGAKNKGGALVGNIMGMAMGIPGLGALLGNIRADNPYEKFQKQMFAEMGYQGDPNKDPFGKNVRSLFGKYDVRDQFDKLAGSKLGEKYGYEAAMADGVLSDEELETMQEKGLKGWQLNRFQTLFEAKKRADAYHKNIRDALAKKEADREARKRDQANISKIEQYTGQRMSDYRRSRPASERQFTGAAPKGTTTFDTKSGMGRRDYVQGGIVSLWPR